MPDGSHTAAPAGPSGAGDAALPRLASLYREHFAFVRRVLRRCGVLEAELDDAVQETFLVVHRRLAHFEGRSAERTWLYAIAIRVASTLRRRRIREHARRERAGQDMHGTTVVDPECELTRAEAAALLEDLLSQLDDGTRTVFVLADLEGLRAPEISRILGVNVNTVHSRLRLARQRFHSVLSRHRAAEAGRMERSRAIARRIADRAEPHTRPRQRQTAWAALVARIEHGDAPLLTGWESLAVAKAPGFVLPLLATLGVGVIGIGIAALANATATPETSVVAAAPIEATRPAAAVEPAPTVEPRREPSPAASDPIDVAAPVPPVSSLPGQESSLHEPRRAARPDPVAEPAPAAPSSMASTLDAETRLIESARRALVRGDARVALAALDEHAKAFDRGLLAAERESSRIKALCLAGRGDDARALAELLDAGASRGRWHRVLASACGAPKG